MIGSSLLQTGAWIKSGATVTTEVGSSFLKIQLDSHKNMISQFLSDLCGELVQFEVNLKQAVAVQPVEQNAPVQVKILCDTFKGQVVGHSKKTDQEIAADREQQKAEQIQNQTDDSFSTIRDKIHLVFGENYEPI